MSYDVTLKRGDTRHAIRAILKDGSGSPVDLTDCSVSFHMAPLGRPPTISRQVDIHDAEAGEVWVVFAPGETDVSGVYRAEFQVTYPDGRKETFPNSGYLAIQILDNLSKVGVIETSITQTLDTAEGASTFINIAPPAGELWRSKLIRVKVESVPEATSGQHRLFVYYGKQSGGYEILNIDDSYDKTLEILCNTAYGTPVRQLPESKEIQQKALTSMSLTSEVPLVFRYINDTNAVQINKIYIIYVMEVEQIVV